MATATVTPGYVFANNELVTYTKLNALGNPAVSVAGSSAGAAALQNYLRNGNFYAATWLTSAGVSCPAATETGNAQFWTVNPQGAAVTYAQSNAVPNVHSLYSAMITGNTSVTTCTLSQTILGDLSDTLNNNVSFSCWILNGSGTNLTPTLIISSANAYNNFSAVTQVASQNLGTITSGQWAFETCTINLTGLSNVNNGIKVSISFPSGSLASNTQSVNVSQCTLVPGTSYITYIDDFGLFSPLGYQPLFTPANNVVLNGNFEINQPEGTYSGLTGTATTKTFDGWSVQTHGTLSVTIAQNTGADITPVNVYNPYITNSGKITVQTAEASLSAADLLLVENKIEGYLLEPIQSSPLSLQFWVRSTTTGQYYVTLSNSNNSASYIAGYTIISANTWQQIQIANIPSMPTGTGTWNLTTGLGLQITWALGLGSSSQTTSGNVGVWGTTGAFGASSQVNVAGNTSNTWEVTGVQLEPGAVCTPLSYITFEKQLMAARRYYWKSGSYGNAVNGSSAPGGLIASCSGVSQAWGSVRFPVEMRVSPVISIFDWSSGAGGNTIYDLNSTSSIGSSAVSLDGGTSGFMGVTFTSGGTAGHVVAYQAAADARL